MTQSDGDINSDRITPQEIVEDKAVKSERLNVYHENQNIENRKEIEVNQNKEREEEEMLNRLRNINMEFESV